MSSNGEALAQGLPLPFRRLRDHGRIEVWGRTPDGDPGAVKIQKKTSAAVEEGHAAVHRRPQRRIFQKTWSSGMKTGKLRATYGGGSVGQVLARPAGRIVS